MVPDGTMDRATKKLLFVSVVTGLGLAGLIHACDDALHRISKNANDVSSPPLDTSLKKRPGSRAKAPNRIAVFSAAAVEIIFELGGGDRIAGVTRFSTYPNEAKSLTDLGGVMDVNFERLITLNPDLIITQSGSEKLRAFAEARHIRFLLLELETTFDLFRVIRTLGTVLGLEETSEQLVASIDEGLKRIKHRVAGRPRVPCFISVDRSPGQLSHLLSVGQGTFLNEILEIAGGQNVFDNLERRYPIVSKEALVARAPEVVLEFKPGATLTSLNTQSLIADWQMFRRLPAQKKGRVHVINHMAGLLPGPRMAEIAREVASLLHPSAFASDERAP